MATSSTTSSLRCPPRFGTARSDRPSRGHLISKIAGQLGQPLMEWQQLVADVGMEYDPDTGIPSYREVIVTVPRQNGKTTLVLSIMFERTLLRGSPQKVAYTAQTGLDGRQKFVHDFMPLLKHTPLDAAIERYYQAADQTGATFKNGSRISVLATSASTGHGKTLDLGIIDEAFADVDDRREQAMAPTMRTRPTAQIWNVSTAGTDESVYLRRKIDAGRAAVADGLMQGIAYFEWSADDDADPDDPAVWRACNPALNYTITEDVIALDRRRMSDGEFRRSALNQWTTTEDRIIPESVWRAICSPNVAPVGSIVLAADSDPNQAHASIVACDASGNLELVANQPGTGWVEQRIVELAQRWSAPVALDVSGPLGRLAARIEASGVAVRTMSAREMAYATADFYEAVADKRMAVRSSELMDLAVAAATKRVSGDSWYWGRSSAERDISPLVAATIAYAVAVRPAVADPGLVFAVLD